MACVSDIAKCETQAVWRFIHETQSMNGPEGGAAVEGGRHASRAVRLGLTRLPMIIVVQAFVGRKGMLAGLLAHMFVNLRKRGPQGRVLHREVEGEPVVIECGECGTLGICQHRQIQERIEGPDGHPWRPVNDIYFCGTCHQMLHGDALENDGSGVLRTKKWTCPNCGTANFALKIVCSHCKDWKPGVGNSMK